jgi:hypothetical protein
MVHMRFEWRPDGTCGGVAVHGFFASGGRWRLPLAMSRASSAVPSGSKYSEDEYEKMIERILSYGANMIWGLAPGQDRGSEIAHASLGATHPAIVEEYLAPLLDQLGRILRNPVVNHRRVEVVERIRLARPITSHTLVCLSTRPDRLAELRQGYARSAVPQQVRQETYDHPANRFVKTLVCRLRRNFDQTAIALLKYAYLTMMHCDAC